MFKVVNISYIGPLTVNVIHLDRLLPLHLLIQALNCLCNGLGRISLRILKLILIFPIVHDIGARILTVGDANMLLIDKNRRVRLKILELAPPVLGKYFEVIFGEQLVVFDHVKGQWNVTP